MACHVLYQPNRFTLYNGIGCVVTQVLSWPTILLNIIWGPIFSTVGVLYSSKFRSDMNADPGTDLICSRCVVYTAYRLVQHRRDFSRVVAGAHSALTTSRFLHLLALSISYLLVGAPLSIYSTISYVRTSEKYYDYSWEYIHSAVSVQILLSLSSDANAHERRSGSCFQLSRSTHQQHRTFTAGPTL